MEGLAPQPATAGRVLITKSEFKSHLVARALEIRLVGGVVARLIKHRHGPPLQEWSAQPDVDVSIIILAIYVNPRGVRVIRRRLVSTTHIEIQFAQ